MIKYTLDISTHGQPIQEVLDLAVVVCSHDPGTLESEAGGLLQVGKQLRLRSEFSQGYYIGRPAERKEEGDGEGRRKIKSKK